MTTPRLTTVFALVLPLAAAAPLRADSGSIACGTPTRTGNVTLIVGVSVDDAARPYAGSVRVDATITAGMSPQQKAETIVANLFPQPHPWLTLTAVNGTIVATSEEGYQIEGLGFRKDETGEWTAPTSDANPGGGASDALCSLEGGAAGFDAGGLQGAVTVVAGPALAQVSTLPGQSAEEVEDELLAQLSAQGVTARLAGPAEGLAGSHGADFEGDGRVLLIEGLTTIEVEITDVGLTGDVIAVVDRPGGTPSIGTNYCDANPNSTGQAARMLATGSNVVADKDLTLYAIQLPAKKNGYFLVSSQEGFVANPGGSSGNLCLGGQIGRFSKQVQSSGSDGIFDLEIDIEALPPNPPKAILPGETWRFQCWFRDIEVAPTSNFTDGIWIEWQ